MAELEKLARQHEAAEAKASTALGALEQEIVRQEQERARRLDAWDESFLERYQTTAGQLAKQEAAAWATFYREVADSPWGRAIVEAWGVHTVRQVLSSRALGVAQRLGKVPAPTEVPLREQDLGGALQQAVTGTAAGLAGDYLDRLDAERESAGEAAITDVPAAPPGPQG